MAPRHLALVRTDGPRLAVVPPTQRRRRGWFEANPGCLAKAFLAASGAVVAGCCGAAGAALVLHRRGAQPV